MNAVRETFGNIELSYSVISSRSNSNRDDSSHGSSRSRSRSRGPSFSMKEDILPGANPSPEAPEGSVTLFPRVKYLVPHSSVVPELLKTLASLSSSEAPSRGELPHPEPVKYHVAGKPSATNLYKRRCIEESKE